MGDVAQGIGDLPFAQRSATPVGEAARLVDARLGELGGERFVGRRFAVAAHHGGDLGVEQRHRHLAHAQVEDFQVLTGGVEDLEDLLVGHQLVERRQINTVRQRIDRCGFVGPRHLGQAEPGPVGAFPHELGIDRDEFGVGQGLAESRQIVGRGNQFH